MVVSVIGLIRPTCCAALNNQQRNIKWGSDTKCTNNKKATSNLQHRRHEDGAAHQSEDHEAGEALLSDAEELGLLPGSRALRLELQAVDVADGEDRGCHEPGQAHQRAHAQHDPHHEQIQVVPTAFLKRGEARIVKLGLGTC